MKKVLCIYVNGKQAYNNIKLMIEIIVTSGNNNYGNI